MGTGLQRFASFLIVMFLWAVLPGCGGGGDSPNTPGEPLPQSATQVSVDPPQNLGTVTLQPHTDSEELFLDMRGSSFMLVANGGNAQDIDIHSVVDPSGATLVTANPNDVDPIGRNRLQALGGSAVAGLFPHTPAYTVQPGRYSFRVRNDGPLTATINVSAIVKHGVNPSGGTLNVNLVFCGVPGLSAFSALSGQTLASEKFLIMFNEFKRIFRDAAHIEIATPSLSDCSRAVATVVEFISGSDFDLNRQADELDKLFPNYTRDPFLSLSAELPEDALTFYFIEDREKALLDKTKGTILGTSGGIPGPARTRGTRHSGVAVSTLGAPANLSDNGAKLLGKTMAHEAAHFLGLFHTTEIDGEHYDPLSDTSECTKDNDTNGDSILEAGECLNLDGQNLMHWDGGGTGIQLTDGQRLVLHRNPLIH